MDAIIVISATIMVLELAVPNMNDWQGRFQQECLQAAGRRQKIVTYPPIRWILMTVRSLTLKKRQMKEGYESDGSAYYMLFPKLSGTGLKDLATVVEDNGILFAYDSTGNYAVGKVADNDKDGGQNAYTLEHAGAFDKPYTVTYVYYCGKPNPGSVSGNATVYFADGGYLYAEAEPYVSYGNDTRRMPGSVAGDGSIYALFSQAYDSDMPQSAAWEHITGFTGDVMNYR